MDDAETARLLDGTSKPCPKCGTRATRFRGHGCHHIRGCPATLPNNTVCGQLVLCAWTCVCV
jgi:hypothetical protein